LALRLEQHEEPAAPELMAAMVYEELNMASVVMAA
jgi:hypothetical protein